MSIQIVSLGNEDNGLFEDEGNSNVVSFYLGHRSNGLYIEDSHPVFRVYQANVLGNVEIVVHECPDWDTFASDLQRSQATVAEGDIIVLKFAVNNKSLFLDIKNNIAPLLKQILSNRSVPVIVLAIGARQNDGPSCTCPMCTSDREICVPAPEGIQLAKDIGATFLELHALNDFYVVKYFGGLLEYFIIHTMMQKSAATGQIKKNPPLKVKPPKLGQPEKIPVIEDESSRYISDIKNLLDHCQCVDVVFCTADLNPVSAAHRVVLCSVSSVFMLLFGVVSAKDVYDSCTQKTSQTLFSVYREPAVATQNSPVRVIVKDALFHKCLPDILYFIYSETKIPAHRAVLVARCDVMAAMFSGSYMEANRVLIPVYGISKDTFLAFLEYIYTDAFCPASILQAMSLLICSEMYQVSRLQHICESYITTQLQSVPSRELASTSLNVVSLLKKAKFHNSESLYIWLLYFVATHYLIYSQKQEFQELSAEELDFVERHKWPSNSYLIQLAEYRKYIHSPKYRCAVM
ncbi:rho-related BTB domain-containing protein 3 isoform X3 [Rhinoderma darwinii]|uniref:rho-related BTB domain-containing protein 3 isoform X3 n=1 Tax=Rhinoderma darwinii TaxID=43563 RepID=UPI003F67B4B9